MTKTRFLTVERFCNSLMQLNRARQRAARIEELFYGVVKELLAGRVPELSWMR